MKASKDLNTLGQMTKRFLQSSVAGKEAAKQLEQMEQYDLVRASWTSDEAAFEVLKNMRGILEAHKDSLKLVTTSIKQPVTGIDHEWHQKARDEAALQMPILEDLLGAYGRAITVYRMHLREMPMVTTEEEYNNIPSGGFFRKMDPDSGVIKKYVKP